MHHRKYIKQFLLIVIILSWVLHADAQVDAPKSHYHEVKVKAGHFFIISDSSVYIERDTTFYLPEDVDYFQRKHSLKRTENFYQNIDTKLHQTRISKLVYKTFFERQQKQISPVDTTKAENKKSESPYLHYYGKLIGDIQYKHLKPFGTDINDTTKQPTKSFKKIFNKLHVSTGNRIIRNNMMIVPGTSLQPAELADNERLVRRLSFIKDARIQVVPQEDSPIVDLLVVTKDVFPLKFDIDFKGTSSTEVGVSHINLFGTGHQLENIFVINDNDTGNLGYEATYGIPNLKGTFINSEFNYADTFVKEGVGVKVFRDFITPDIRYAGGLEGSRYTRREPFFVDLTTDSSVIVTYNSDFQEIWAAKAVRSYANPPLKGIKERVRLVVAGSISRQEFLLRPLEVEQDTNFFFHDRTLFLASIGYSTRKYYKDLLVTNFGRTEDIPIGNLAQITVGYEMGEFESRTYLGGKLAKGRFVGTIGYLKLEGEAGGFIKGNSFEQGVIKGGLNFFSRLHSIHFFRVRQFINANYTIGVRRNVGELININDENGLRGVNSILLRGTQRATLNTETLLFTPLYFVGFRMALFGFADFGIIESSSKNIFEGKIYKGFGFGFRLKNDNLAFSVIQLRFGFYSNLPKDSSTESVDFATRTGLSLDDFDIKKPAKLDFN